MMQMAEIILVFMYETSLFFFSFCTLLFLINAALWHAKFVLSVYICSTDVGTFKVQHPPLWRLYIGSIVIS